MKFKTMNERKRRKYEKIIINYQMMISVIKQKHRLKLETKESMYNFIRQYIDSEYDSNHTKQDMLQILESYLTNETIHLYIEELDRFGVCKKDLLGILGIRRSSMIDALEVNGISYKNISYHTSKIPTGRYHLLNPSDILKLNGFQPE